MVNGHTYDVPEKIVRMVMFYISPNIYPVVDLDCEMVSFFKKIFYISFIFLNKNVDIFPMLLNFQPVLLLPGYLGILIPRI